MPINNEVRDGFNSKKPISIVYMTSLRELHQEGVGRVVVDPESGVEFPRLVGNLEDLANQLNDSNSPLYGHYNISGIIADDDDAQLLEGINPLWDQGITIPFWDSYGRLVRHLRLQDIIHTIPSRNWAAVDYSDHDDPDAEKRRMKTAYEITITAHLEWLEADIVVCDSYLRVIGDTLLKYGRDELCVHESMFINIHPGITDTNDPSRLPGATPTRDAVTRALYCFIIIDDKQMVDLPDGDEIEVEYEGVIRRARKVKPTPLTAASVHFVSKQVDNGKVIHSETACLPKRELLSEEFLRQLNYQLKRKALKDALFKLLYDYEYIELACRKRYYREYYSMQVANN